MFDKERISSSSSSDENHAKEQNILMDTTIDYLVTSNIPSNSLAIDENCLSSFNSTKMLNTSMDESILDLSQRPLTTEKQRMIFIENWNGNSSCNYTDEIDNDEFLLNNDQSLSTFNIEQSLTDQLKNEENLSSDTRTNDSSQIDFYCSKTKKFKYELKSFSREIHSRELLDSSSRKCSSNSIVIHQLEPCFNVLSTSSSSSSSRDFRWSKYLSLIGERSVAEEFFDHYLASIESGLKIDMKIEYCYDIEHEFYWISQLQFVSDHLLRLHYFGLPEDETSNDFWVLIDDQRCHPIGWCKQNNKSLQPPPIVNQRINSQSISHEIEDHSQTPADYLFDKVGQNPN